MFLAHTLSRNEKLLMDSLVAFGASNFRIFSVLLLKRRLEFSTGRINFNTGRPFLKPLKC